MIFIIFFLFFKFCHSFSNISITDGWEYEMQSAQGKNKNQTKLNYIQVLFVTNVQAMLECFISLYELKKSSLQDAFLHPSIQYEDMNGPADSDFVTKDNRVRVVLFCFGKLENLSSFINTTHSNQFNHNFRKTF